MSLSGGDGEVLIIKHVFASIGEISSRAVETSMNVNDRHQEMIYFKAYDSDPISKIANKE